MVVNSETSSKNSLIQNVTVFVMYVCHESEVVTGQFRVLLCFDSPSTAEW